MGALFNGLGRLFWGIVCDKIGFKKSFMILTAIQAGVHVLYPFSASNKYAFLAMHSIMHVFLAGNFALMPPAIQRMFGPKNGALIYGLIYSAFGTASIASMMISKVCISLNIFCIAHVHVTITAMMTDVDLHR
jgi:OFA family oxalate/formate antiporter-like MFS transporter